MKLKTAVLALWTICALASSFCFAASGKSYYQELYVRDRIFISTPSGGVSDTVMTVASGTAAGQELVVIKGDGKVGVGTISPAYAMDVKGDVNISGAFRVNGAQLASGMGGSGTAGYIPQFSSQFILGNSAVYQNNGKVGIGTTGPNYTLDVSGDINTTGSIRINGTPLSSGMLALIRDFGSSQSSYTDRSSGLKIAYGTVQSGAYSTQLYNLPFSSISSYVKLVSPMSSCSTTDSRLGGGNPVSGSSAYV